MHGSNTNPTSSSPHDHVHTSSAVRTKNDMDKLDSNNNNNNNNNKNFHVRRLMEIFCSCAGQNLENHNGVRRSHPVLSQISSNSHQAKSCKRLAQCLVGRQMRKLLALASLVIALYGYVTVMSTSMMAQQEINAYVRSPSREDHYITQDGRELPLCPPSPKNSQGLVYVNQTKPTWSYLREQHQDLQMGGHWTPTHCIARHKVAIVIPYRNRETNLLLWLQHMHPFLKKQNIEYTVYIMEQSPGKTFNRGLDRNVAFVEAEKLGNHDCTIFHDVDLLPIDDRNLYICPDHPRHMCVATNYIFNYMPLYNNSYAMFGGVTSFRNDQFRSVNGYSNIYFGWGAEDDDLYNRLVARGMPPYRYPDKIGRYYGSPHTDEAYNPVFVANEMDRFKMLRISGERIDLDGLNTMRYTVKKISKRRLFTWVYFDIEQDFYSEEAKRAVEMYHDLYGDLSPFWKHLKFTPVPYQWKNKQKKH